MLINFGEPKKLMSAKDHADSYGFDGGPAGGYMPNMSAADAERWKAKHINSGKENARIELRKTFTGIYNNQCRTQVTIFVALDGWDYAAKYENRTGDRKDGYFYTDTRGLNVRMSMNGPLLMTFEQFAEINQIVEEAKAILLETKQKTEE
jgi:hypothetical protein